MLDGGNKVVYRQNVHYTFDPSRSVQNGKQLSESDAINYLNNPYTATMEVCFIFVAPEQNTQTL
jgi:hypothetical protein